MTERFKYRAFLSYSHDDSRWAQWLHRKLETFTVPQAMIGQPGQFGLVPERIGKIFKDRDEFAAKADLGSAAQEALSDSLILIVICSPSAAKSRWVNEEVARFQQLRGPDQVLALLVEGDPGAAPGSANDCFPPALRTVSGPAGELRSIEPLAADLRRDADGRHRALTKLAASLLGIDYDQLAQREAARRNRRMAIVTAASLTGVVVTSALAISAVLARQEAEQQRTIALLEAETASRTSEFMVDLFSVNDPGEHRGKTITAAEILERGRQRVARELKDQPRIRNRLMTTMGRVYTGLGLYDTAAEILAQAAGTASTNQSPQEQLAVAVALGNAEYLRGNYDAARSSLQTVIAEFENADLPWSRVHSDAHLTYGATLIVFDELTLAEQHYRLALAQDIQHWGDQDTQVAKAQNGLGSALLFQGQTAAAQSLFVKASQLFNKTLGGNHPLTVETQQNLAAAYYFDRKYAQSMAIYENLVPIYRQLLGDQHPELASLLNNLGRTQLETGKFAEADVTLSESVAIDRALGRERLDEVVFSLNSLAVVKTALQQPDLAIPLFAEALQLARENNHRLLGPILAHQAELRCTHLSTPELGLQDIEQAEQLVLAEYGQHHWRVPLVQNIKGVCLFAVGKHDAAQALLRRSAAQLAAELPGGYFASKAAANLQRAQP